MAADFSTVQTLMDDCVTAIAEGRYADAKNILAQASAALIAVPTEGQSGPERYRQEKAQEIQQLRQQLNDLASGGLAGGYTRTDLQNCPTSGYVRCD